MGGFTGYTHIGEGGTHDLYEAELPVERTGYVTDLLSDRARAYVEAAANSVEPYFLSLHYNAPHWPWSAPSIEAEARQREVDPAEMMEGGSPRIYGEMMENLDAGIGRVMDAVRRSGKDTLVVFTSDNGGERYSNIWPFVGRKWDLLEGGLPEFTADRVVVAGPRRGGPGHRPRGSVSRNGPDHATCLAPRPASSPTRTVPWTVRTCCRC